MQRVALASIGQHADAKSVAAVGEGHARARELGDARARGAGARSPRASRAPAPKRRRHLKEAATKESYALVREAALVALATYDKNEASQLALTMAQSDPEPRVRETATKIRSGK